MKKQCNNCGSWYNQVTSKICPACRPHWYEERAPIENSQVTRYIKQTARGMARSGQRRRPGRGWKIV